MKTIMKTITVIISAILIFSCNSKIASVVDHSKPDTSKTLALYHVGEQAKIDVVFRIVKDSLIPVAIDSMTTKKQWAKDTAYYVPFIDSTKKVVFALFPKNQILIDGGKDIDTLFKKYKIHFALPDTTKGKG